jgi:hypothetical protein
LCVAAATGEISAAEWQELNAHLAECGSCQSVFGDMREIHSQCVPDRFDLEGRRGAGTDDDLRSRVLQNAVQEGARFSKAAIKSKSSVRIPVAGRSSRLSVILRRPGFSFAAGAIAVVALFGTRALLWHGERPERPIVSTAHSSPANNHPPIPAVQMYSSAIPEAAVQMAHQEQELRVALKHSRQEAERLEHELADAQAKMGELIEAGAIAARRIHELDEQMAAANANQTQVQAELTKLLDSRSTDQVILSAQKRDIRDLHVKLEQRSAEVDREEQLLLAGGEIRDVIAARNLHIIDVYDTDGDGRTKKAFGRAFYTEGKSLLLYAYDLPSHRPENVKYGFYAWGKSDGNEKAIRSLGLMYNDDQSQKRWVLKITDPQVLSQIDSVFITLERSDELGNRPKGTGILSAYLRSPPNHP